MEAKIQECMDRIDAQKNKPELSEARRTALLAVINEAERKAIVTMNRQITKEEIWALIEGWGADGAIKASSAFMGGSEGALKKPCVISFNTPKDRNMFLTQSTRNITDRTIRVRKYIPKEYMDANTRFQAMHYQYKVVTTKTFPDATAFIDFEDIALVLKARETKNGKKEEVKRYFPTADDYHGPGKQSEVQQRIKGRLRTSVILTKVQRDIDLLTILGNLDNFEVSNDAAAQTITLRCNTKELAMATFETLLENNIIQQSGIEVLGPNLW